MPRFPDESMKVEPFKGEVDGGGAKWDKLDGKNRLDLIPTLSLKVLGWVYTHGAQKYADNNWMRGIHWSRIYGAVMRHMTLWYGGEDTDPDSGLPHLGHAAWGVFTLIYFTLSGNYESLDDRVMVDPLPSVPPMLEVSDAG